MGVLARYRIEKRFLGKKHKVATTIEDGCHSILGWFPLHVLVHEYMLVGGERQQAEENHTVTLEKTTSGAAE